MQRAYPPPFVESSISCGMATAIRGRRGVRGARAGLPLTPSSGSTAIRSATVRGEISFSESLQRRAVRGGAIVASWQKRAIWMLREAAKWLATLAIERQAFAAVIAIPRIRSPCPSRTASGSMRSLRHTSSSSVRTACRARFRRRSRRHRPARSSWRSTATSPGAGPRRRAPAAATSAMERSALACRSRAAAIAAAAASATRNAGWLPLGRPFVLSNQGVLVRRLPPRVQAPSN